MGTNDEIDILLVEDNADDAEVTQRALRRSHLANRIYWARDGVEALQFLFAEGRFHDRDATRTPRLILLDLKLPKLDGAEVLRAVRADPRTRLTPVVMMTSSTQEQDVIRSYELGVNGFVSKPVGFEEFAKVISGLGFYWLLVNRPPVPGAKEPS
ncbi:response regulator [Vulcaniibacterium gelatinicum]|uniref:response regulator n=1 Tax=Vulcaniibacterium gelatinicum TaxID=2598725 RepID=UPI0011C7F595|nr:response regulator [Vulcaniibacterium gelatinicum]